MQSIRGYILIRPILLAVFLLLIFFYSFDTSQKISAVFDFHQQNTMRPNEDGKSETSVLSNYEGIAKGIQGSTREYKEVPESRLFPLGPNSTESKLMLNDTETYIFSKSKYFNQIRKSKSKNVIVFLVASCIDDARLAFNPYPRLRAKISKLNERLGDNCTTDIIIFHTGYPFRKDLIPIIENTCHHIEFINIDQIFYKFSPGFDPHIIDPTWSKRGKWNYHHMCYFWFKQVFEMKIIQQYRYIMRLDDDSQILGKWPNIFDLMTKHQAIYMANRRTVDFEHVLPGLTIVRNLTAAYIAKNRITVRNPVLLADIFSKANQIPNYWNNFEIVDLSFMRRKEVTDFIQFIDESKGIFLYRWGDAPLRYIILALFAKPTQILHRKNLELAYCHMC